VSIVITVDKALADDTIAHFDCGAATYGLVLAAWSKGIGSVINGQGIMTCVAMGYPDDSFVANDVKSRRSPNDKVASFIGFD
jgi:hypothetical protein